MLKQEDRGIDRAVIRNSEGVRISSRTSIQTLFDQKFVLSINDTEYEVIIEASIYCIDQSEVSKQAFHFIDQSELSMILSTNQSSILILFTNQVAPPQLESLSKEDLRKISDVKLLVSQLYEALNIEEYQLARKEPIRTEYSQPIRIHDKIFFTESRSW